MSSNPFTAYYINQAGSGIGGFQGARFQRGQGFFGNIFKSAILPLLKYIGPKLLTTAASVGSDAIQGENIMNSLKARGKTAVRGIAADVSERANTFAQTGRGRRRRRRKQFVVRRKSINNRKKVSKRTKKAVRKRQVRPKNSKPIFNSVFS